jgi:hypothetical protein
MIATLNFAGLVLTTIFAAAAAVVCNWLFLRVMFNLMRPAAVQKTPESATANQPTVRSELMCGTAELARALAPSRRAI